MKKFESKKISDNELTLVSGGTVEELWELAGRIFEVQPNFLRHFKWEMKAADMLQNGTKVGKVTGPVNKLLAWAVEGYMNCDGINADISIGFLGTGVNESPNRYSYGGRRISHKEALKLIQPV